MRDPSRIYPMMEEIKKIWFKYPDLRFGQLVDILFNKYYDDTKSDPFYAEDTDFMDWLKTKFKGLSYD